MKVERFYRNMIVFTALVYLINMVLPWLWFYIYSESTLLFFNLRGANPQLNFPIIANYLFQLTYIACFVGLYYFVAVARTLFTLLILFNLLVGSFFLGYSASAFLDTAVGYLLSLLEGATLVMIYCSSVALKFKKQ